MPGNNFLAEEASNKPKGAGNRAEDKPVVEWTEPLPGEQEPTAKSNGGFFGLFRNTGNKKTGKENVGKIVSDFVKNKETLHEYNSLLNHEKAEKNRINDNSALVPETNNNIKKPTINIPAKNNKSPERPWTLKTNLIKEEVTTFVNWRKNIALALLGLIFVAMVIGGFYSYFVYKEYAAAKEEKALSEEIAALEAQISQAKKQIAEADDFQKKLDLTADYLSRHIYWSEFFKFLEKNTLASTFYASAFSGDSKSNFKFSVITKSYQDVDDQLRVFKASELVLDAKVSSAALVDDKEISGSEGKIKYDLELSLSPDVFKRK